MPLIADRVNIEHVNHTLLDGIELLMIFKNKPVSMATQIYKYPVTDRALLNMLYEFCFDRSELLSEFYVISNSLYLS